jgi:hypothetical protein
MTLLLHCVGGRDLLRLKNVRLVTLSVIIFSKSLREYSVLSWYLNIFDTFLPLMSAVSLYSHEPPSNSLVSSESSPPLTICLK